MLVVLNLTMPPILLLFLPAALAGNYALPAPPASEVAAFSPDGTPLPTWVVNGTLYVLQGGEPAVAVYVPAFTSSNGVYRVEVARGPLVAQAPPGIMVVETRPQPSKVVANKTGLYLYFDTGAAIAYHAFTVEPATAPPPPATTPTAAPGQATAATSAGQPLATATTPAATAPSRTATTAQAPAAGAPATPTGARGQASSGATAWWAIAAVLAAIAVALILVARGKLK